MDQKIPIDIVILPPEEVLDQIVAINQKAIKEDAAWGRLGKDDFLPHISLAMGGIEESKVENAKATISEIVENIRPIPVELNELYSVEYGDSNMYCLRARKSSALQTMHENLMNVLHPYFSYDCTAETLYADPGEQLSEPAYINKFASKYSFEAFDPHVTLRIKKPIGIEMLPINFAATTIAMCHVGTMTTCRKILFATHLNNV